MNVMPYIRLVNLSHNRYLACHPRTGSGWEPDTQLASFPNPMIDARLACVGEARPVSPDG